MEKKVKLFVLVMVSIICVTLTANASRPPAVTIMEPAKGTSYAPVEIIIDDGPDLEQSISYVDFTHTQNVELTTLYQHKSRVEYAFELDTFKSSLHLFTFLPNLPPLCEDDDLKSLWSTSCNKGEGEGLSVLSETVYITIKHDDFWIKINSPTTATTLKSGERFTVKLEAGSIDGVIIRTELYVDTTVCEEYGPQGCKYFFANQGDILVTSDNTKLGRDIDLVNLSRGIYTLRAVAYDDQGKHLTSNPITVFVE